jgi:Tol biopolymer transport system component
MNTRSRRNSCSLGLAAILVLAATVGHAGQVTRISLDSAGNEGNGRTRRHSVSADGRFVAFCSDATNVVPGDANGVQDVFLKDRQTGATVRLSVDSAAAEGDGASRDVKISADGRFVAFASDATNLVADDTNGFQDVFVHDRVTGATTRVSVGSAGEEGDAQSASPVISADGHYVAFTSDATNLVPGDTNASSDIFVHNLLTGRTIRVSVDSAGVESNGPGNGAAISGDGRFVVFSSDAFNLVPGDTNGMTDIFIRDQKAGTTSRVSVDAAGSEADASSSLPAISADGRFVAFVSDATNLAPGDTNAIQDVYLRDRTAGTTTRVSVAAAGGDPDGLSYDPAISADGRFVAFGSDATNLVTGDVNGTQDIFVRDMSAGPIKRVNVDAAGAEANLLSYDPALSADGRFVAFGSRASNLVAGDTNATDDIFLCDRRLIRYPQVDMELAVTAKPDSVNKGAVASYTFQVTNKSSKSASEVTLVDVSSKAVMSMTPSQGNCRKSAVSVCRFGTLAAGASATVTVTFTARIDPLTQSVTVRAAQADAVPANNSATLSTPVIP